MNVFSTATLADQIYGSFDAIFRAWHSAAFTDTHLWELTQDKTPLQILEQDLIDIGHFFSAADSIGERSETYLIAECIAELRARHGQSSVQRKAEDLVDEIGEWLLAHPELASEQREKVYAPICYRVGQLSVARGISHEDTLAVLRKGLVDLAYHFLLRDGNITGPEDQRMKEFHAALSG